MVCQRKAVSPEEARVLWSLAADRGSWACFEAEVQRRTSDPGLWKSITQVGLSGVREAVGIGRLGQEIIVQGQTGPHSETLTRKTKTGLVRWLSH